jgi:hypothetical protein
MLKQLWQTSSNSLVRVNTLEAPVKVRYQEVQRVTGDEMVIQQPFDLKVDLSAARAWTVRSANLHGREG